MKKHMKHSRNLSKMIRDPKMTPSRKLFAEMVLLSLDCMDTPLGERFLTLTEKVFGGKGAGKANMGPLEDDEPEVEESVNTLKSVLESLEDKI